MDDTHVTLQLNDIEILEDDPELTTLIDSLTRELQSTPQVRPGRRFTPRSLREDETTGTWRPHRTWYPR
jgi:hypothetical protein